MPLTQDEKQNLKLILFPNSVKIMDTRNNFFPLREKKTMHVAIPINKNYGYLEEEFELE